MQAILENLNNKQYDAVINTEGPCLIIAGAGSGKTKVLTHKIAYLIQEKQVKPWNILAITFTNKAANEMKTRINGIIGDISKDMWIGTFHSICVRILRRYIDKIGYNKDFVIFDTSDQKSLVKQVLKELNIDDKLLTEKSIISEISRAKNELLEPKVYRTKYAGDFRKEKIGEIYELYQKKLKSNNALDFDDIINKTINVLTENIECLEHYVEQFKYILVDEYQDTNKAQFTLITLLSSKYGNITVVGDNDQSIYAFRGADITNILNFEKDFPGTKIIKLEQNYRCTGNILSVANSVIKNNEVKYEKKLWTENEEGKKPMIFCGDNEYDEATFLVEKINEQRREEYYKYSDFAVLYRMNSQSRAIEDILRRENIPYKIVGGLKFYERKEIKDIISYLRIIHNLSDNLSLKRVINEPKRGIGKTSLEKIEEIAVENQTTMFDILKRAEEFKLNRVAVAAKDFVEIIESLNKEKETLKISELITKTLSKTGYTKSLELENTIEAESRIQNLDEFLTVAIEFEEQFAENSLAEFLENITLSSDLDNLEDADNSITLMTLHSAKGLEFAVVFLVGMEDGIFPGYKSISEPKELSEERRLCYVGITRAKQNLYLTAAKQRTIFGQTSCNAISRFIKEIPETLLDGYEEINKKKEIAFKEDNFNWSYGKNNSIENTIAFRTPESFLKSLQKDTVDCSNYQTGTKVYHKKFGQGIIKSIEQEGEDYKLDINFEKLGNKRLMAKYANLEILPY